MGAFILLIAGMFLAGGLGYVNHTNPAAAGGIIIVAEMARSVSFTVLRAMWNATVITFLRAVSKLAFITQLLTAFLFAVVGIYDKVNGKTTVPWWVYFVIVLTCLVSGLWVWFLSRPTMVLVPAPAPAAPALAPPGGVPPTYRAEYDATGMCEAIIVGLGFSGFTMIALSGLDPVRSSYVAAAGSIHLLIAGYALAAVVYAVAQMIRFALKAGEFSADFLRGLPFAAYTKNWAGLVTLVKETNWADEDKIPPNIVEWMEKRKNTFRALLAMLTLMPWYPLQGLIVFIGLVFWDVSMPAKVFFAIRMSLFISLVVRMIHPQGEQLQQAILDSLINVTGYGMGKTAAGIGAVPGYLDTASWSLPTVGFWWTILGLIVLGAIGYAAWENAGEEGTIRHKVFLAFACAMGIPFVYLSLGLVNYFIQKAKGSAVDATQTHTAPQDVTSPRGRDVSGIYAAEPSPVKAVPHAVRRARSVFGGGTVVTAAPTARPTSANPSCAGLDADMRSLKCDNFGICCN